MQVPAQLAIFPLDTFKTRLQIPFGAPGAYQGSDRAFAVRRVNALQVSHSLDLTILFGRFLTVVRLLSAAALLVGCRSFSAQPAAHALDCVQCVRTSKRKIGKTISEGQQNHRRCCSQVLIFFLPLRACMCDKMPRAPQSVSKAAFATSASGLPQP